MPVELKIPPVGESISEVQIGEWRFAEGDQVNMDDNVVELESEKATFDVPAPVRGVITKILKRSGDTAAVGEVIGYIDENAVAAPQSGGRSGAPAAASPAPASTPAAAKPTSPQEEPRVMPAARRAMAEHGISPEQVEATGPGGRILKEDVLREAQRPAAAPAPQPSARTPQLFTGPDNGEREEKSVPMSPIRRRIAQRLVEAQQTAALLTTFNEVDMTAAMELRKTYKDAFQEKHGVKLGFMSFFVKAVVDALKLIPQVNAEIRGTDIIYRNYHDIGIAVGGGKGLVVPVLRNAERMSFAEIELTINDLARRARENELSPQDLQGGTFTISNGGVYGSLLSTPIVNPPQSGVLGMHTIQERPMARNGQVVIRPMMYVALTYDHRIVDGREAVTFLRRIKDAVEDPARLLLEV